MRQKLLFLLLSLCFLCQYTSGQQAVTVKSFTKTTDHISVNDRRTDLNGNACALIKVQVLDDIDRIEGNNIGDIVNKGVEKWIYMCKGSRNIKIHFKNHLPLRVVFSNYRINSLESNKVYELELNAPNGYKEEDPVEIKGNDLKMIVSPTNAIISIWGDNYPKKTYRAQDDGTLTVHLPYDRYYYLATASGYKDKEGSVFVNDEDKWEDIIMEPISGILIIQCPTKKVDFSINGQVVDKEKTDTKWFGQLIPGQYEVQAIRKGYVTQTQNVTIVANETTIVNFEELITQFQQSINDRKEKKKKRD